MLLLLNPAHHLKGLQHRLQTALGAPAAEPSHQTAAAAAAERSPASLCL